MILDELDAFPFVGNEVLQAIANQACVGQKLLLSATPDELSMELVKQKKMELVCLFERPHKHPLIVPKVIQVSVFTTASLIQIFGRVGRSFKDPDGKGVCLCQALNKSIKDCVSQISKMNDTVYAVTNR